MDYAMRLIQSKSNMETKVKHLLEVKDLYTSFNIPAGEVRSVNGVSFKLDKGKILGIVGESGSGKSVTAYSVMQILQNPGRVASGSIKFNGIELLGLPQKQMQKIRGGKISIIFQDPMSSLNPVYTIGNQIKEAIRLHPVKRIVTELDNNVTNAKQTYSLAQENYKKSKNANTQQALKDAREAYHLAKYHWNNYANERALEMLKLVGINEPEKRLKQYPFEFSGGMLQRIMIAMSLVCEPDLLIADEPTTALDVTIQAQILELLKSLQKKMGMGIIIITHDLGVVAQVCDEVDVMYAGRIVERGTVNEIFYNPQHEYTKGLMKSIPQANDTREHLEPIEGNPVDVFCLPKGCSFAPRCKSCMKICLSKYPPRFNVNNYHETCCFKYLVDAYHHRKITKKEFEAVINNSSIGNAGFKTLSHLDVFDAYNDKVLALRMYKHVALASDDLTENEKDVIYYRVKEMNDNYIRVKKDYYQSQRTHNHQRKELPSMERGDMAHHIKEAKKRVKYVNDFFASKESLFQYLEKLNISSYPINYKFHRENVALAKFEYEKQKEQLKKSTINDKLEKIKLLCAIDDKKHAYEDALDCYERNHRVTHKLLKTRQKLIKINAQRVKRVIKNNAKNAFKEFKSKHLMFTKKSDLENYLKNFVYAHWDFDQKITAQKITDLRHEWDRLQDKIYEIRSTNKNSDIDDLIKEKNLAMYRYWFTRYDYKILRYYKKIKFNFETAIRFLNNRNHNKSRIIYRERGNR